MVRTDIEIPTGFGRNQRLSRMQSLTFGRRTTEPQPVNPELSFTEKNSVLSRIEALVQSYGYCLTGERWREVGSSHICAFELLHPNAEQNSTVRLVWQYSQAHEARISHTISSPTQWVPDEHAPNRKTLEFEAPSFDEILQKLHAWLESPSLDTQP